MPRFFFHVNSGLSSAGVSRQLDENGVDLPSLEKARVEAVKFAGEVLAFEPQPAARSGQWRLEVTNKEGALQFLLAMLIFDAPDVNE